MYYNRNIAKEKVYEVVRMFQNIENEFQENFKEDVEPKGKKKKEWKKEYLKKMFSIPNIILYVISFMISTVGFGEFNPFGLSILAALCSNGFPIGPIYIIAGIGTLVGFGTSRFLEYLVTGLFFFVLQLIIRPKISKQDVNEKRQVGLHIVLATFFVQMVQMLWKDFLLYDGMVAILSCILVYLFYKIFTNSISVIKDYPVKKAFSIEEVMGASLLLAISAASLREFSIFGYSIRNILSILLVLILGFKNGILVGATGGITIGVVLGIIGNNEPIVVASYAISGMIAGIFNKLGKIGVIVGFILGNIVLTYVANGATVPVIVFQEILIASLGLLAVPKNAIIDIEDLFGKTKLLASGPEKTLEQNQNTIYKLNNMSEAISEMAKTYSEVAATAVEEITPEEVNEKEKNIFIQELRENIQGLEDNIIYDDIAYEENGIVSDIYHYVKTNGEMQEQDLISIFEKHNNYIVGFENNTVNQKILADVTQMVKAINYTYKISKINFVWKKKMEDSKNNMAAQLEGVSKAIENLAEEITPKEKYAKKKEEITLLLQQKGILVQDISFQKEENGKTTIELYTNSCENVENGSCSATKIGKLLSKIAGEKLVLKMQKCAIKTGEDTCKFTFASEDKFTVQIGIAKATKTRSDISGDSSLQTKLEDGKYLVAISDGMGSGKEAKKSSSIAIKMLEKMLTSGFDRDNSIHMINSILKANTEEDMYATLDIAVLDLYLGNIEFIKNGACPTYLKTGKNVQLIKSLSLPTGILENIDLSVYDKDIQDGDILVMCSDGIIESNGEYANKELWVKYLLEDIQTEQAQKIADIILGEAIDNNYGMAKDDMTVIVMRLTKNN